MSPRGCAHDCRRHAWEVVVHRPRGRHHWPGQGAHVARVPQLRTRPHPHDHPHARLPGGRPRGPGRRGPHSPPATCVARRTDAAVLSMSAVSRASPCVRGRSCKRGARASTRESAGPRRLPRQTFDGAGRNPERPRAYRERTLGSHAGGCCPRQPVRRRCKRVWPRPISSTTATACDRSSRLPRSGPSGNRERSAGLFGTAGHSLRGRLEPRGVLCREHTACGMAPNVHSCGSS